jgi:hypothetical protein
MKQTLLTCAMVLASHAAVHAADSPMRPAGRPNILVIVADDKYY